MADQKVTELGESLEYNINEDLLMIVDVSDTSMAASGTNKKLPALALVVDASRVVYDDETNNLGDNIQVVVTELNEIISNIGNDGTWLVSGGGHQWLQDYDFDVSAATYYILGTFYTAPMTSVTLDAADADDDRFDAIVADTDGVISVLTGVPSPTPVTPFVNPSSQVALSYIRVDAASTEPGDVQTEIIYRENVEWTTASNSGNIVANSATDPYAGSLVVGATNAVNGNAITFTDSLVTATDYSSLNFYIKIGSWPRTKSLNVSLINTTTTARVGVAVIPGQYGLVDGITTYQLVSIPISTFGLSGQIDRLEIAVAGGAALSFAIDNIELFVLTGGLLGERGPQGIQGPAGADGTNPTFNGEDGAVQTLAVGTDGTDFNIVSAADVHTFHLPDASTANRGAITTGTQTIGGQKTFDKVVKVQTVTVTPAATTAAMDLGNSNHQTLSLVDATGTVTFTITPPAGRSAGTILVKQHATTVRDLTWALSSGTMMWMGGEPDWATDAVSKVRVVSWMWDGSVMYFAATDVNM